ISLEHRGHDDKVVDHAETAHQGQDQRGTQALSPPIDISREPSDPEKSKKPTGTEARKRQAGQELGIRASRHGIAIDRLIQITERLEAPSPTSDLIVKVT